MRRCRVSSDLFANRLFLVCLCYGLVAIAISLAAQAFWLHQPCRLCDYQRWLTVGIALAGLLGYWRSNNRVFLFILTGMLIGSLSLAVFHFGVQMEWFPNPCKVPFVGSSEAFRVLFEGQSTSCQSSSWRVFGIPINLYVIALTATLTAFSVRGLRRSLIRPT